MAIAATDIPLTLGAAKDLEKALNTDHPVLLYVYGGESLRGDVKTELENVAKKEAGWSHPRGEGRYQQCPRSGSTF
jgi:hypothetical protein